ncbi:MAG TPA: hypothetical protein VI873_03525 [Candidatus Peribacteraceae bacterium]|nr:hypothetical protein [Candidatus Peribacteraceae bacterium]
MTDVFSTSEQVEPLQAATLVLEKILQDVQDPKVLETLYELLGEHLDDIGASAEDEQPLTDDQKKLIAPESEERHVKMIRTLDDRQILAALESMPWLHSVVRNRFLRVLRERHPDINKEVSATS